jgi:hypothetical protein
MSTETTINNLQSTLGQELWNLWSKEQQAYILEHEGASVKNIPNLHSNYHGKKWELGASRPEYGEKCPKCDFKHCFYAQPRNWSMNSSADVWNLMKCANVECQSTFESCL